MDTEVLDWRADMLRAVLDIFSTDIQTAHTFLHTFLLTCTRLHFGDGSDALNSLAGVISAQVKNCFFLWNSYTSFEINPLESRGILK